MTEKKELPPNENNPEHPILQEEFRQLVEVWDKMEEVGAQAVAEFLKELESAVQDINEQWQKYLLAGTLIGLTANLVLPNILTTEASISTWVVRILFYAASSKVMLGVSENIVNEVVKFKENVAVARKQRLQQKYNSENDA